MSKQDKIEELQTDAYLTGIEEERQKVSTIIGYIISKNTTGKVWEEEVDYEGVCEDLEELSQYLRRKLNSK